MEQELNDLEFSLPAEFLTDSDLLSDFRNCGFSERRRVDASTGTVETESDEDELIVDLARKYSSSTLGEGNLLISEDVREGWKLPSSPQSTLCGCKPASEIGSKSVLRICSPQGGRRWDLLYAAAEEAARVKMIEETAVFYSTMYLEPPAKPKFQQSPTPAAIFHQNQTRARIHLSYHQLQSARFEQMRLQQIMKNGGSTLAWPHQAGSGMTAVFLRGTGVKERPGTGVFMPRRFGPSATETHKKPAGCSSVLLPDKVVHALNLKMDPINSRVHGCLTTNNTKCDTSELMHWTDPMLGRQRRNAGQNQELQLPPEWTYY